MANWVAFRKDGHSKKATVVKIVGFTSFKNPKILPLLTWKILNRAVILLYCSTLGRQSLIIAARKWKCKLW